MAATAGVSRATASRVLRGNTNVSADARQRVERAAAAIAYTPNLAARSLVTRRSGSVAFVVAEGEERLFTDPYFLNLLRGAHREISAAGLQLIFVVLATAEESATFQTFASGGHVDGVLLVSLHGDDALPRTLEKSGVPTVSNGRPLADVPGGLCFVDSDNVGGGRAATQLLLDRGAQRIATISGPLDMAAGLDRLAGFHSAMADAGRRVLRKHVVHADFSIAGGETAMRQLLAADPSIDAVFAASDLTAVGAMRVLVSAERRVPDDVAVVGFDNIREAELAAVPLTTIAQPIEAIGATMARRLLERLAGHPVETSTIVNIRVVRRDSA